MAELGGGNFADGLKSGAINEIIIKQIGKLPLEYQQLASALIGAAVAKITGGDENTGASVAASATKNNYLSHWQKEQRQKAIEEGDWEKVAYWDMIDKAQDQAINAMGIYGIDLDAPENYELLQQVSSLAQNLEASSDFQESFINGLPTIDSPMMINGTAALVVGGGTAVVLYNYNGSWMRYVPFAGDRLFNNGVKAFDKVNALNFTIKSKHLNNVGNLSNWNKFNVSSLEEASAVVNSVINSAKSNNSLIKSIVDNGVGSKGQQSYKMTIDAGRVIGTRGETAIRVVYDDLGNIWTVFPEKL